MSSMLDYHTPHLSLPAQGHEEGGNQVIIAFCGVSCGPVQVSAVITQWYQDCASSRPAV
jgi:hypothetical protein